jgi:hypothetical protein
VNSRALVIARDLPLLVGRYNLRVFDTCGDRFCRPQAAISGCEQTEVRPWKVQSLVLLRRSERVELSGMPSWISCTDRLARDAELPGGQSGPTGRLVVQSSHAAASHLLQSCSAVLCEWHPFAHLETLVGAHWRPL